MEYMAELDYSEQAQINALIMRVDLRLRRAWDSLLDLLSSLDKANKYFTGLDSRMRATARQNSRPGPPNRPTTAPNS